MEGLDIEVNNKIVIPMKPALKTIISFALVVSIIIFACQKIDIQRIMAVKTKTVGEITSTTANVKGEVVDLGDGMTEHGVYYSTTVNAKNGTKISLGKPTGTGEFVVTIDDLTQGTKYYICAFGARNNSFVYGDEVNFTTLGPPILTTSPASTITSSMATIGGNISHDGGTSVTDRGVYWRLFSNPDTIGTKLQIGNGIGTFSIAVSELTPNTTYTFKAYASNSVGTTIGAKLSFTTSIAIPTVITANIVSVTGTTATTGGTITSAGGDDISAKGVCWGTELNPTISLTTKTLDGTGISSFVSSLTNLLPNVTYHVRAYAINTAGTGYGEDKIFSTSKTLPVVTTAAITAITINSATSGGNVLSDGGESVIARGVCWSISANPTIADNKTTNGTGTGTFISSLSGLAPGILYHVRAYASNALGTGYGEDILFTTNTTNATVTTTAVSSIGINTAISGGSVTSDGGSPVTARGVCWSTSVSPTVSLSTKTVDGTGIGTFSSTLTGLTSSTTYHVRAYATNALSTVYGADLTFTTFNLPTTTTNDVTNIVLPNATCGGNITSNGGATITARGVCWSTNPNPTITDSKTTNGTGTGTYTSTLVNLQSATTYYVRAYAINSVGTGYGSEKTFTTGTAPTVTTADILSITGTSASSGGNVEASGGSAVTARGVCWSTGTNPTTANSKTVDGAGTGLFTSSITSLAKGTTYYLRAYATNTAGTSFGQEKNFTTLIEPTVTTADITSITATTAISGGEVIFEGNTNVTERGICYSTSQNPTTANPKMSSGTGSGVFTSNITSLNPNTTYYVRAFAVNSIGTSYGIQKSFTTGVTLPAIITNYISYIEGNSCQVGGTITSDGGALVIARGVCWSLYHNPTLNNEQTYDGTGIGSFMSTITGLSLNTTYYVRAYASNSVGTVYGNEISISPAITTLGANYQGGIVFYIDTSGQHGLVCAPTDQSTGAPWGCYGTTIGSTSTAFGAGLANTMAILNGCSDVGIAVRICYDLVLNGYDDWYLPSKGELNLMYSNLKLQGLGGLGDYAYWSSSEYSSDSAWPRDFRLSYSDYLGLKTNTYRVRAIRAF